MKTFGALVGVLALAAIFAGCSSAPKSPDVSGNIRKSLDQAGLKNVSVSQDREKGVVTLGGNVPSDSDKAQAESIARSMAAGQVVADQIGVMPPDDKSQAKTINSDLDQGIDKNLDAALVQRDLKKGVRCDVKNGVVTLSGDVNSQTRRNEVAKIASTVPNVVQVVNELQIREQKATSSN